MSWEPLGGARVAETAPVTISSSAGVGRMAPQIYITLRLSLLPPLPFLAIGQTCDVLFGRGENAGLMRIVPGTRSMLGTAGRHGPRTTTCMVHVRAPDGIKPEKRAPEAVTFKHGEDWLEIKLPTWAVAVERVTTPAPATRHVSITERVADPAAELRGRAGR